MGALVAASIVLAAAWVFAVIATGTWRELHHFYYGVPLVALAALAVVPLWAGWLGFLVMADDTVQHMVQIIDPEFRSPLHRLYAATLYRWLTRQ